MKVSDAIARVLVARGVRYCFELVGGMITHMLDSLVQGGEVEIVSMHHEQAAAFAAEGMARSGTGCQLAVAMGTSGPGATNLVTGIGSCWFDSIPCLFITGQVNTGELKGDSALRQQGFQELDIVSVVKPITKYATQVMHVSDVLPVLHQAISIALSGRKGPVLVDIPNDIQRAEISDAEVAKYVNAALLVDPVDQRVPSEREISELLSMCRASRRPLVCIGGGARWSSERNSWRRDLDYHGIPYVSTLMGCERVPAGPQYFGMIGAYGRRVANWAVQNCDLLLVLGARLDVRQTGADTSDFARCAKLVQVDIDSAQLNNRVPIDLAIWCSIDKFFDKFQVEHGIFSSAEQTWRALLQEKKLRYAVDEYRDWNVSPTTLFSELNRLLKDKPVEYVCDVGNHQMWAAQALELGTDQAAHYSGGMGAMGFALPAAIGIAVSGKRKVIVITGDGSLQVNIQEFDTVCRLGLDVGIIVLNNFSLGMVKNFQDMYFGGRDQSTRKGYSCPKFTEVARAYGLEAEQVGDHESLSAALRRMTNATGPFLIEVNMERATECRPRLAFGHKLDDQYPPL